MKVKRLRYYTAPGKLAVIGYVSTNWFERRVIRRMMLSKRHNLKPTHNYPAGKLHRAQFILRAKGRVNVDTGPMKNAPLPRWLAAMVKPEFCWLDFVVVCLASVTFPQYPWSTLIGMFIASLPLLVMRHKRRKLEMFNG